jgi:hypothetical protein
MIAALQNVPPQVQYLTNSRLYLDRTLSPPPVANSALGKRFILIIFVVVAEPSGKPQVTAAHNASSTLVYLEWTLPPANSLHGEFLGYLLSNSKPLLM